MASETRPRHKIDVVVGIDGSAASTAVLRGVAEGLGRTGGIGRLAVVEAVAPAASIEEVSAAHCNLAIAASDASGAGADATAAVIRGDPADALRRYARHHRFDVIAVGTRGAGETRARVGTTAKRLVQSSKPGAATVLIVDTDAAMERPPRVRARVLAPGRQP